MRAMVALHTLQCSLASRGVEVEVAAEGVGVTLIDFTLSRLVTPDGATAFCDLEADPELFAGPKGDCQARRPGSRASFRACLPCKRPACYARAAQVRQHQVCAGSCCGRAPVQTPDPGKP